MSCPFALITTLIRLVQNSLGILRIQANLIASVRGDLFGGMFFSNLSHKKSPKVFDRVKVGTVPRLL